MILCHTNNLVYKRVYLQYLNIIIIKIIIRKNLLNFLKIYIMSINII